MPVNVAILIYAVVVKEAHVIGHRLRVQIFIGGGDVRLNSGDQLICKKEKKSMTLRQNSFRN